jgi:hypothetical protein
MLDSAVIFLYNTLFMVAGIQSRRVVVTRVSRVPQLLVTATAR